MSQPAGSRIQTIISVLAQFEAELDATRRIVEELQRNLLVFASEEAEMIKQGALREASEETQRHLGYVQREAEEEAKRITAKATEDIGNMKRRIDKLFDEAVKQVIKEILGA